MTHECEDCCSGGAASPLGRAAATLAQVLGGRALGAYWRRDGVT